MSILWIILIVVLVLAVLECWPRPVQRINTAIRGSHGREDR